MFNEESLMISSLTLEDIDEILKIERSSFPDPWSRSMFEREIGTNNFYTLREKDTKYLLAYFGWWQVLEELHILNLAVVPEYRRQGLGSFILEYILKEARKRQCKKVLLEVRAGNTPARNLYSKYGLLTIGQRKNYYANGEDALLLEKQL